MNNRYIAISSFGGVYGVWGAGSSKHEAFTRMRNQLTPGDRRKLNAENTQLNWFTSTRPFAPPDREATDKEADAYVEQGGSICWVRCVRQELDLESDVNAHLFAASTWRRKRVQPRDPA